MGLLEGKIALVTGGARGLGEALCHRLHREGCRVHVADVNYEGAARVAREVAGEAHLLDVTDYGQCEAVSRDILAHDGRIDLLICNAAIVISGPAEEFDPEDWRRVIDVNLCGYFNSVKALLPCMLEHGGSIVQINSKSGKRGSAKNSAYAAGKFGGIGLTQSLALEYATRGIRVNCVCPGNMLDSPLWVNSLYDQYAQNQGLTREQIRAKYMAQSPMGRGCEYDDVCNVVVFLASDLASYMTGQATNVTGGQEMR